MPGGIQVPCRKCGKPTLSTNLVLDPVYRMVVCPECVKARKARERMVYEEQETPIQEEVKQAKPAKPAGWDAEDEYLEKMTRLKQKTSPQIQRVDAERVRYTCQKCKYNFLYNTVKQTPIHCPYCGTPVTKPKASF